MTVYDKLRPFTDIEACECDSVQGILLVDLLTENPIHCLKCKKEIDPELLDLSNETVELIHQWKSIVNSLYLLWLDSGEYENWAKSKLLDKNGEVNKLGLEAVRKLSDKWATYLWWFWDTGDGEPSDCPVCENPLDTDTEYGSGKCDKCMLYI